MTESFSDLMREVLGTVDAGAALRENTIRRKIAVEFEAARKAQGLSVRDLAKKMGTSVSQIERLRHEELGGSLTLRTICKAAQVLGLAVTVNVRKNSAGLGNICELGTTATWQMAEDHFASPTHVAAGSWKLTVSGAQCASEWEPAAGGASLDPSGG